MKLEASPVTLLPEKRPPNLNLTDIMNSKDQKHISANASQKNLYKLSNLIKNLRLLILLLAFQLACSQNQSLKEMLAKQTGKATDTIFRLETSNGAAAEIPATLISGKLKGPTLTIVAGIHGTAYRAIASILRLRKELNPEKLKGNLILIPVLNMESFYSRGTCHPIDRKDLNRSFPGTPLGSATEVIADFITTKVFDATDVFLEVHGGDPNKAALPFIGYYENAEFAEQTRMSSRLCEISGFNSIVRYPYDLASGQPAIYPFKQAMRLGIPSLSMHIGKAANAPKTKAISARTALYNILAELNMLGSMKNAAAAPAKVRYSRQSYVLSPAKGFFRSSIKPGQKVFKDEEIGYITDTFGRDVKIVTAPSSGTILRKATNPPVNKGETLFFIGY